MPKPAFAAALSLLPLVALAACGGREGAPEVNGAVAAGTDAAAGTNNAGAAGPSDPPALSDVQVDRIVDPVPPPPPDAVSHPNGYLPPAPGEPPAGEANASVPDGPATEDQYLRNRQ